MASYGILYYWSISKLKVIFILLHTGKVLPLKLNLHVLFIFKLPGFLNQQFHTCSIPFIQRTQQERRVKGKRLMLPCNLGYPWKPHNRKASSPQKSYPEAPDTENNFCVVPQPRCIANSTYIGPSEG